MKDVMKLESPGFLFFLLLALITLEMLLGPRYLSPLSLFLIFMSTFAVASLLNVYINMHYRPRVCFQCKKTMLVKNEFPGKVLICPYCRAHSVVEERPSTDEARASPEIQLENKKSKLS